MSQLMIQSGAGTIAVPMKCDVSMSFYWYGPEVSVEDTNITKLQYDDFVNTGKYYDESWYKKREEY